MSINLLSKEYALPDELKETLKAYFTSNIEKLFNTQQGGHFEIEDLVNLFPKNMRNEILKYVYQDAIQKVWFLKKRPPEFYEEMLPFFTSIILKEG